MRPTRCCLASLVFILGASLSAQGATQLVANPYFTEWARAKPVGWSALGEPEIWWTDSRAGAKRTVNMIRLGAGDGIMQRIAVESRKRYFIRAWTGAAPSAPGEMIVSDVESGDVLFKRAANRPWNQEHVGFFTAKGNRVDLAFRSVKGGTLEVDNVVVAHLDVDPTPSRVAVPEVPVFYASYDPRWTDALGAVNIVSAGMRDVRHLADLRGRGVLVLTGVQVPNRGREIKDDLDAQVEKVAVDFVDLAPMKGLNESLEITSIEAVDFGDLPRAIVVKGKNLLPKDIVRIGREIYCDVTFVSTNELRARVPELIEPGEYDITVRHDDWLGQAQSVTITGGLKIK